MTVPLLLSQVSERHHNAEIAARRELAVALRFVPALLDDQRRLQAQRLLPLQDGAAGGPDERGRHGAAAGEGKQAVPRQPLRPDHHQVTIIIKASFFYLKTLVFGQLPASLGDDLYPIPDY